MRRRSANSQWMARKSDEPPRQPIGLKKQIMPKNTIGTAFCALVIVGFRMHVGALVAVEWFIKLSEGQGRFKISWPKIMSVALPLFLIINYENFNAFLGRMDSGLEEGISLIFLFNGYNAMPLIQVFTGYTLFFVMANTTIGQ